MAIFSSDSWSCGNPLSFICDYKEKYLLASNPKPWILGHVSWCRGRKIIRQWFILHLKIWLLSRINVTNYLYLIVIRVIVRVYLMYLCLSVILILRGWLGPILLQKNNFCAALSPELVKWFFCKIVSFKSWTTPSHRWNPVFDHAAEVPYCSHTFCMARF